MEDSREYLEFQEKLKTIQGFFGEEEAWAVREFVRTMRDDYLLPIVEIGSFMGRSTFCLADGLKNSSYTEEAKALRFVIAVDHFKGSFEHQSGRSHASEAISKYGTTFLSFKDNMDRMGVSSMVIPMATDSETVSRLYGAQIKMLFIDADHSYDGVKNDFLRWSGNVVRGGYIAIHDVAYTNKKGEFTDKFPGVTKFYNEIDKTKYKEVLNIGSSLRILEKL